MMSGGADMELLTVAFTFVLGAVVVFFIALFSFRKRPSMDEPDEKDSPYGKKDKSWKSGGRKDASFLHPWLASTLKGHTGRVLDLDFASNGKYLVSAAEDRSLILWKTSDFTEKQHKSVQGNVEFDHARLVRFAPDSKSLVLALAFANKLAIYKLGRKEEGGVRITHVDTVDYPKTHVQDISALGVACSGRFIMTASVDTKIVIWDLRGNILKAMDVKQNTLHQASVSPCGRFVASSGFTPDVLVWEVKFHRTGNFVEVKRAFELKGHSSGVLAFDFSQDSSRMVTASKDGTWRLWDTDVRYEHGQDPRLVRTGSLDELKKGLASHVRVALAPNGNTFAIALGTRLLVFRWDANGEDEADTDASDVHSEPITSLRFSPDSHFLVTAGDRQVRVFHNVSERLWRVWSVERELKTASTEAHRQRLKDQLQEATNFLAHLSLA